MMAWLDIAWPDPLVAAGPRIRWATAPGTDGVSLCLVNLDDAGWDGLAERTDAVLSAAEKARAERFRRPGLGERYRRGRHLLRALLARQLSEPACGLVMVEGAHGKPSLAHASGMQFNLSHSGAWALIAIGGQHPLGVDIEGRSAFHHLDEVAKRVMTPLEFACHLATPLALRPQGFLRTWTRKEACLKALGTGFHVEPSLLDLHASGTAAAQGSCCLPVDGRSHHLHWADIPLPEACDAMACWAWTPSD